MFWECSCVSVVRLGSLRATARLVPNILKMDLYRASERGSVEQLQNILRDDKIKINSLSMVDSGSAALCLLTGFCNVREGKLHST
jgi:hypothetical protein